MADRELFQINPGRSWYLGGVEVEELRTVRIGSECYVCLKCAALVEASPSGAWAHGQWHGQIAELQTAVKRIEDAAGDYKGVPQ